MKLGYMTAALVIAGALVVGAQETEHKSKTKVSVKEGDTITVTGCVKRAAPGGFILTDVAGKDGTLGSYSLVLEEGEKLDEHIGHRVELTGKAADKGKGKIKVETKTETKVSGDDAQKTESKAEVKGDLKGLPFLAVKSVKMLATVCP
jgi:hypothetical protein